METITKIQISVTETKGQKQPLFFNQEESLTIQSELNFSLV